MKKLILLVFLVGVGSTLVQAQIKAGYTLTDSIICEGDFIEFTNTSTGPIDKYTWNFTTGSPQYWIGINPPPPPVVFLIPGSITVQLAVQDSPFTMWSTKQTVIQVYPLPGEPEVFVAKCYLATNTANSYQWFFEDSLIPGATDRFYTALEDNPGYYSVEVTNTRGCSSISDPAWVDCTTGLEEIENDELLSFYPNPFSFETTLVIDQGVTKGSTYTLSLYNTLGQEVKSIEGITSNKIVIQRDNLTTGLYFFNLTGDNGLLGSGKIVVE